MSLVERAKALLLLKDALGDLYAEQKQLVIDETLALPLAQRAVTLSSFVQAQFITSQELAGLLSGGSSGPAVPTSPVVSAPAAPQLRANSKPEDIQQFLQDKVSAEDLENYVQTMDQLHRSMSVSTLQEFLNMEESHQSFGILDEILSASARSSFFSLLDVLAQHVEFVLQSRQQGKEESDNQVQVQQRENQDHSRAMFQFHGPTARAVVLPIGTDFYYYTTVELEPENSEVVEVVDSQNLSNEASDKSQYIYFCLDISASMNHDENGQYCAPKSRDHPHSSIKKARELIPTMVLRALHRYAIVYIIVWNYKVQKVIQFTPSMFLQEDANEFVPAEEILASVKEQTSDSAFVAKGGTNMESALTQLLQLVSENLAQTSSAEVWFLTDGEETVYVKDNGSKERIPSNPNAPNFGYFNHLNHRGVTGYQEKLIQTLKQRLEPLDERNIPLEFHSCQFSDADPIFLRFLCDSVSGSFHTLADVSNLEKEMEAGNKASSHFYVTFEGANSHTAPAAINNGVLCARGKLPTSLFLHSILPARKMVIWRGRNQYVLDRVATSPFEGPLRQGVKDIIELEPALDRFMERLNADVQSKTIRDACNELNNFRNTRMNALASIARIVRAGTQLQMYLETILESVESQIDSLERLLSQYQLEEGKRFDSSSAKENDLLSIREKSAIAVGLDSMRVRLGNGIVSQNSLDKRLRQLITKTGARARQLLNRRCILIESTHADRVWLSLYVVEGNHWLDAQTRLIDQQCDLWFPGANSQFLQTTFKMVLRHGDAPDQCLVDWTLKVVDTIPNTQQELSGSVPVTEYVGSVVTEYHCQPLEDNLEEHRKRFIDPLSYCNFTDLIRENNTLPAFLYRIRSSQSVGLVFNAKELVFVEDGGTDATSFDYFRLYWRLARKSENNCVVVPGAFTPANAALPMAPEPLTHAVLAKLMPGLLSEFVTGTPMAPMPCSVLFYCGYLMMHLFKKKLTGVDISRSVEILSTIAVWLDNPQTSPGRHELDDIVNKVAVEGNVVPKDSPGKTLPVKALVYCMIDDAHPVPRKFHNMQSIVARRWYKHLNNKPDSTLDVKSICLQFVETAAGPIQYEDEVPVTLLDAAEEIAHAVTKEASAELLQHSPSLCKAALDAISTVMHGKELEAWARVQKVLFTSSVVARMSVRELQERFKNFEDTSDLEDAIFTGLQTTVDIPWQQALVSCWSEDGSSYSVLTCNEDNKLTFWRVQDKQISSTCYSRDELHTLPVEAIQAMWSHALCILRLWYWKGRKSNCYGMHEVDYEVIAALKDVTKTEQLSQMQLSEYHAALAYKKPAYAQWIPEKEEEKLIDARDNVSIDQSQMFQGDKPRISMIVIGAVDSGKSTTSGHLIYERGHVSDHLMRELTKMAADYGRPTFKYAWIMDRLKNERERGVTVELSYWSLETDKYQLDLLDAPGHQSFLKNMAAGASLSDGALLVVSAAPDEFERGICRDGMTRQEALLAYASGVRQFIVAINKMDVVDYSEERFNEVKTEVASYLKKLGLDPHRQIFVPISGYQGDNLTTPSEKMPWFTQWECRESATSELVHGKTLLNAVDYGLVVPRRSVSQPIRVPVNRIYRVRGVGTVLCGRLLTGSVEPGQEVMIAPLGKKGVIRTIESFHKSKSRAYAGDIVGVHVPFPNTKVKDIPRGIVISPLEDPAPAVRSFTARVIITNHNNVRKGFSPYIYCHTASFSARFVKLVQKLDKRSGAVIEENPDILHRGDVGVVQVALEKAVCVEPFSKCPPLGRFVIQISSSLVGVGQILEVSEEDLLAKPAPLRQAPSLFSQYRQSKPRSRYFR